MGIFLRTVCANRKVHEQSVSHCSYHILRKTAGDILFSCGLGNINEVDE